jgi:hypothetical protein
MNINKDVQVKKPHFKNFKGDYKNKYKYIFHTKSELNINEDNNFIFLAVEYPYNNNKVYKYLKVPLDEIDYVCSSILKYDNKLNEILIKNKPIKPFLDLEQHLINPQSEEKNEEILNKFIEFYKEIYKKCFKLDLLDEHIIILNSNRINKMSYHIIINNNHYFKNIDDQRIFSNYVYSKISKSNDNELHIMDKSVYTEHNFRMVNQCKINNEIPLKNNLVNIKDTLILNYCITDETKYLNVTNIKNNLFKKNNVIENEISKDEPNIIYDDFEKQKMNELLSLLHSSRFDNYDTWFNIMASLPPTHFDLFESYSKNSIKYDEFNNKYKWETIHDTPVFVNKYKIQQYAKEDNEQKYKSWIKRWKRLENIEKYEKYIKLDLSNIKVIKENCRWFSQVGTEHENNIFMSVKHMVLYGYLGIGKTKSIIRLIEKKIKKYNKPR